MNILSSGWLKPILQQVGLFLLGAFGLEFVRLFLLPGAKRRRRRLGYLVANFGRPPKGLPEMPAVSILSGRVIRVLGQNAGPFTLQGTNTYILGTGKERILIDTSDGNPAYLALLLETLKEQGEGTILSHIVITHDHEDHVGGVRDLRKVFSNAKIWKKLKSTREVDPTGKPYDEVLENGTLIVAEGCSLRCILTPGHATDHVSLFLQEEQAMFTGDCVLGSGTTSFEDLHEYMGSLRILLRELSAVKMGTTNAGRLYPGHGCVVENGVEKVENYISHRQLREDNIVGQLNLKPRTIDELVEIIYKDQNLNWIVKRSAKRSVQQHLEKLVKEGKAARKEKGSDIFVLK